MDVLMTMVEALLRGRVLTVTGLGRGTVGTSVPKHQIKKADRLIGNMHLRGEQTLFYEALARLTIGNMRHPVILVDWSDISEDRAFQKLRASLAVKGRALTLYEEVHDLSKSANPKVQEAFLKTLQALIPEQCRPVIVTDAGFKNPWFKAVQALGWDFVGWLVVISCFVTRKRSRIGYVSSVFLTQRREQPGTTAKSSWHVPIHLFAYVKAQAGGPD